jgi:S1-C subfamily serine protease
MIIFPSLAGNSTNIDGKPVSIYLQDISVTIRASGAQGSGVIFTRKDADGVTVNFVWTAGHVVSDLRSSRKVISSDGVERTIVEFRDAKIVKTLIEDGRTVGTLQLDAEVIRYTDADAGEDLALLRVRKKNFIENTTVKFYLEKEIPTLGTDLYHVGSLLGEEGANSMTSGIYSQQGRLINKTIFDQTTVIAFPGSSGGGVFLKDGHYVGMLVRGAGEAFNLIIPIRRMSAWAKSAKVEWAINPLMAMPSSEELKKLPVEDIGKDFKNYEKAGAGKTFLQILPVNK